jgi:hypothetical protein
VESTLQRELYLSRCVPCLNRVFIFSSNTSIITIKSTYKATCFGPIGPSSGLIIIIIIYLLTAIGLSPGGSTHLHTNNTQNNTNNNQTTQITIYNPNNNMWKSAGCAPSLQVFTLAFALQLRKKHGKTTVRVRETSVRLIKKRTGSFTSSIFWDPKLFTKVV